MKIPRASIWPTVSFNTTEDDGMAAAREWVPTLLGDNLKHRIAEVILDAVDEHPVRVLAQDGYANLIDANGRYMLASAILDALLGPESAAEPSEAPTDHPNPETANNGLSSWPPPKPGTHESQLPFQYPLKSAPVGSNCYAEAETWSRLNLNRTTP